MRKIIFWMSWLAVVSVGSIFFMQDRDPAEPNPPAMLSFPSSDMHSFNFPDSITWSSPQQFYVAIKENFKTLDDECDEIKNQQIDRGQSIQFECASKAGVPGVYTRWEWTDDREARLSFENRAYKDRQNQMIALLEGEKWMGVVPAREALSWAEDLGVTPKWLWRCTDRGRNGCDGGEYFNWSEL